MGILPQMKGCEKKGTILIADKQEILGELHLLSTDAYSAPAKKTERDAFRSANSQRSPASGGQ